MRDRASRTPLPASNRALHLYAPTDLVIATRDAGGSQARTAGCATSATARATSTLTSPTVWCAVAMR